MTCGDEPLFFRDPADDLLRHGNLLGFKGGAHPAVPVAPIAAVEHLRYADAQGGMLAWPQERIFLIEVAALGHSHRIERRAQPMRRPQALYKDCLFPVREHPGIDASVFSQKLHRPLQDGALRFRPVYGAPQGSCVFLELLDASAVFFFGSLQGASSLKSFRFQL